MGLEVKRCAELCDMTSLEGSTRRRKRQRCDTLRPSVYEWDRKDDFITLHFAGVTKAQAQIEWLGTSGARNIGEAQSRKESFAANMIDDQAKRSATDASTLKTRIDHEAPHADLRVRRRRRQERLVLEHDKSREFLAPVDCAVPSRRCKERLRQRDGVRRYEALLIVGDGEIGDRTYGLGRDLAKRHIGYR